MSAVSYTSITKIEYYDDVVMLDLNMVGFVHLYKNVDDMYQMDVTLLDAQGNTCTICQKTEDEDGELLREKQLDLYTQWKNNQKSQVAMMNARMIE